MVQPPCGDFKKIFSNCRKDKSNFVSNFVKLVLILEIIVFAAVAIGTMRTTPTVVAMGRGCIN